jgi:hypothetical protein
MTAPSSGGVTLRPEERRGGASLSTPAVAAPDERPFARDESPLEARPLVRRGPFRRHPFRRGPWEALATLLIAAGVVMLMQPVSFALFGWSFAVILTGTAMFVVVSHFPD